MLLPIIIDCYHVQCAVCADYVCFLTTAGHPFYKYITNLILLSDLMAISTYNPFHPSIHTIMCWYLVLSIGVFYYFYVAISKNIGHVVSLICLHGHLWWNIYLEMNLKDHRIINWSVFLIDRLDGGLYRRQIKHITPNNSSIYTIQ